MVTSLFSPQSIFVGKVSLPETIQRSFADKVERLFERAPRLQDGLDAVLESHT
jgi:hypothetical protein